MLWVTFHVPSGCRRIRITQCPAPWLRALVDLTIASSDQLPTATARSPDASPDRWGTEGSPARRADAAMVPARSAEG